MSRVALKATVVAEHIHHLLARHVTLHVKTSPVVPVPPLFVALQGPQGIGKTSLTHCLQGELDSAAQWETSFRLDVGLAKPSRGPKVAVLSLDDFYLPHQAMVALASTSRTAADTGSFGRGPSSSEERDPRPSKPNKLLSGRGLPGTHDLPLLTSVLTDLSRINHPVPSLSLPVNPDDVPSCSDVRDQPTHGAVETPTYDKGAFSGQGDRNAESRIINGPVDVVLLEGWCMGFYPISDRALQRKWNRVSGIAEKTQNSARNVTHGPSAFEVPEEDLEQLVMKRLGITVADISQVNHYLHEYVEKIYPFFTGGFIQLSPPSSQPYSPIYGWRLEQEHWMKAHGGQGMTDDEVKLFVDRYIPAYMFFRDGVTNGFVEDGEGKTNGPGGPMVDNRLSLGVTPWAGKGLRLFLDAERNLVDTEHF